MHAALPQAPRPQFYQLPEDVSIREYQRALFQCEVFPPETRVRWFLEDGEVENSQDYRLREDGGLRVLEIPSARKRDEGYVKVVLIGEDGDEEEAYANLTVEGEDSESETKTSREIPTVSFTHFKLSEPCSKNGVSAAKARDLIIRNRKQNSIGLGYHSSLVSNETGTRPKVRGNPSLLVSKNSSISNYAETETSDHQFDLEESWLKQMGLFGCQLYYIWQILVIFLYMIFDTSMELAYKNLWLVIALIVVMLAFFTLSRMRH